jgi:hypothetical protein
MSGTTLAHVTMARSRLSKEGAELATAQPMRKCVIGLINVEIQITQAELLFNTTDKKRTGNTCSTTELLRHLVPEAGLEPATTSL